MQTICTLIDVANSLCVGFIVASIGITIYSLVYSIVTDK